MKPSTRKALLFLLLGIALVLLSFEFAATSEDVGTGHLKLSSTTGLILEYSGAIAVFIGVITFIAASLTLAFSLHPNWTMKFGAMLVLSFIASFIVAVPYFNGHSWTMFPVMLSALGCLFALLIVAIGFRRWLKHRNSAKTNP